MTFGDGGFSGVLWWKILKNGCVATLALGSRPRQGFARLWAKREAQESHFMLPGM